MRRKISLVLVFVLLFSVLPTVLTGCREKQAPIYRGMGWDKSVATAAIDSADLSDDFRLLSADGGSTQYGRYDGDYVGKETIFDEKNPFGEQSDDNMGLREAIIRQILGPKYDASIVITPPQHNFEDVFSSTTTLFLNIFLDNPDNYEIVSFTLNGELYTTDEFESGSSMENIVVKPKVIQTTNGFIASFSLKIENIKYRDGDEIKDVIMEGKDTIDSSEANEIPLATVSNMNLAGNALTFDLNLSKSSAHIVKGEMLAVIYNGKSVVTSQDVFTGDNQVTLDGLRPNTLYQCAVGGYCYDADSGESQPEILYTHTFVTDPIVQFDSIKLTEAAITFDYYWNENHADKNITMLTLYKDGVFDGVLDSNAKEIILTPGTSYKLVAEYSYGERTESITLEFTAPEAESAPEIV